MNSTFLDTTAITLLNEQYILGYYSYRSQSKDFSQTAINKS